MYLEHEGDLAAQISIVPSVRPGASEKLQAVYELTRNRLTSVATDHDAFAEDLSDFSDGSSKDWELVSAFKMLALYERTLAGQFETVARLLAEREPKKG